ncbi:hypothetical protein LSUE1_G005754 [Lachnellula suecica]|uniref:Uncharacterized protein n=1 Tax=Lachnellula suecica TaxID=602035 RepID=A0A8T9C6B3_9HELO|nr:hypothetical protein LSUE1_G005754 [Lachnellula suecica]
MSRVRGVVPLFVATAIGIGNGKLSPPSHCIWVFGPAFKEQQQLTLEEARKPQEALSEAKEEEIKTLRAAEAAASKVSATEAALKPEGPSSSWWPKFGLSTGTSAAEKPTTSTNTARGATQKGEEEIPGGK